MGKPAVVVEYDFNNAKSLKIYPRKSRQPLSGIALSNPQRVVRTALNAAEKELKHVMGVANRRMKKVNQLIATKQDEISEAVKDKEKLIENIVTENVKAGGHLVDEVFIPEYLGFEEIPPEEGCSEIRIYIKEGFSITRFDDRWLISSPDQSRTLVHMKNMHNAIIILEALGVDVNFKDYLDCKYDPERKTLQEAVVGVLGQIIENREKEEQSKIEEK